MHIHDIKLRIDHNRKQLAEDSWAYIVGELTKYPQIKLAAWIRNLVIPGAVDPKVLALSDLDIPLVGFFYLGVPVVGERLPNGAGLALTTNLALKTNVRVQSVIGFDDLIAKLGRKCKLGGLVTTVPDFQKTGVTFDTLKNIWTASAKQLYADIWQPVLLEIEKNWEVRGIDRSLKSIGDIDLWWPANLIPARNRNVASSNNMYGICYYKGVCLDAALFGNLGGITFKFPWCSGHKIKVSSKTNLDNIYQKLSKAHSRYIELRAQEEA